MMNLLLLADVVQTGNPIFLPGSHIDLLSWSLHIFIPQMTMTEMTHTRFIITEADEAVLRALGRFHYLKACQLSRLLYPNLSDEDRYAQRRLKRLTDADYVLRLRALPTPRYGQPPHVFTLARRGRQHLVALGVPVRPYFRPSEETRAAENNPFMTHRLAAIDVLIAGDCLCRNHPVTCPRMLTERELKQAPVRVDVPAAPRAEASTARRVAVIPDAWFQLCVAGEAPVSIALELDRGTEDQMVWRQKVAALAVWAVGPYRKAFATDNLTIAVVCPDVARRDVLAGWTMRELEARGHRELVDIFLFTCESPVSSTPAAFFFGPHWFLPHHPDPVPLLDRPPEPASEEVSIFAT
jgi:hypothetical protein